MSDICKKEFEECRSSFERLCLKSNRNLARWDCGGNKIQYVDGELIRFYEVFESGWQAGRAHDIEGLIAEIEARSNDGKTVALQYVKAALRKHGKE